MNSKQLTLDGFSIIKRPCREEIEKQGRQANLSGRAAEDTIYCILKERGYAVRRQVVIDAISISGGKIKVDFFVEGVLGFESGLIIESKWQDIGGSVDQKLVFLAMNIIERYTFPTIIVCGGKGAASGIIDRIKSKIDNRKLIAVFSFEEFLSWAIRNL